MILTGSSYDMAITMQSYNNNNNGILRKNLHTRSITNTTCAIKQVKIFLQNGTNTVIYNQTGTNTKQY